VALKEEVMLNVKKLNKAITLFPKIDDIDTFLRADKKNRPLITFTYYATVFKTRTEVLQDLNEELDDRRAPLAHNRAQTR
jgi:hypothetical protein